MIINKLFGVCAIVFIILHILEMIDYNDSKIASIIYILSGLCTALFMIVWSILTIIETKVYMEILYTLVGCFIIIFPISKIIQLIKEKKSKE